MRRQLAVSAALAALALAGCGSGGDGEAEPEPGSGQTRLSIAYRETPNADPVIERIDCARDRDGRACRAARAVPAGSWDPVPPGKACTEIYGGPETARIAGTVGGRGVDADFSRVNGCEIERWDSVSPLLEAVGAPVMRVSFRRSGHDR